MSGQPPCTEVQQIRKKITEKAVEAMEKIAEQTAEQTAEKTSDALTLDPPPVRARTETSGLTWTCS